MGKKIDEAARAANKKSGGSTLTRKGRTHHINHFFDTLNRTLNIQIKSFSDVKEKHIRSYVEHCKAQGTSDRTLQNRLAGLRSGLRAHSREKFADQVTNAKLGVAGASRDGTHQLPDKEKLVERLAALPEPHRILACLQIAIGLRAREAIQCARSLPTWAREIERGGPLTVVHGTKGGRLRQVSLDPARIEAIRGAVGAAIRHLDQSQKSEILASKSLEGAARDYQRKLQAVGFVGAEASHSLRYGFAKDQFDFHLQATGGDRAEALARLSLDLGHGDGRGRYVRQVYLSGGAPEV